MTEAEEQVSPNEYDEYFQSNDGFVMARKGRYIIMQSHRSEEQQRALLRALRDGHKETKASIQSQIQEILDIIRNYDPFDILANISLRNSVTNPEEFKEYESKINPAYTEYIALLYLSLPYESYNVEHSGPIPANLIEDIQKRIQNLFISQTFYLIFKDADPDRNGPIGVNERFRFLTLMESLFVRYPSYHHHLIEDLRGIFSPLSSEMESSLGFTIDDAILILDAVGELINLKLAEKRNDSIQIARDLRKAVKNFRHKKKIKQVLATYPRDMIEDLAKEKPSVSSKRILNASIGWTFHKLGKTFILSIDELVEQTKLNPACITSFLKKFSLQFGDVAPFYRTPAPTHPLMRKPFIEHEGLYFCPVINSTYWALRPAIEDFWNPSSNIKVVGDDFIWQKYLKSRANYLESTAITCLTQGLRYATAYQNLKYDVVDGTGKKISTELDGLLILDNALFLVEAKSGSLSLPARRGAPSMKEDLTKLVEEAYSQALRASNYITNNDRPIFRLSNGNQFVIDKDKHNEIFLVTVSLDDLDTFVTNTHKLKEFGLLQSSNQYPWAVTLANLRVICELNEFSSQLVHYIKRRLHLNELGWVNAHDELDWFGHYLLEGLYFDSLKKNPEEKFIYNLLSYSWIFDDYYYYVTGQRKKTVDRPTQKMPPIMREVLAELDRKHDEGYLMVACCLLDMSSESRKEWTDTALKLRQQTKVDREIHSITMPFTDGDFGFAFFTCPSELENEFLDHIMGYSILKKYQTRFHKWVTIGCISDTSEWVDYFVVIGGQWVFDQELDAASNRLLQPWPRDKSNGIS